MSAIAVINENNEFILSGLIDSNVLIAINY